MTSRVGLQMGLAALLVMAAACTESGSTGPSGPSSLSSFMVPQIDGLWGGRLTLTGVATGAGSARNAGSVECVVAAFGAIVGETVDHTLSISQSGADLTARLVSAGTGLACTYSGRIGSDTAVLAASTCGAPKLTFRCPPDSNGLVVVRQLELMGSSVTATIDAPVNVTTMSGTAAHTYNILDDAQGLIGTLVTNHRFTSLTRR
jgi:hypothetical protein